ncbi:hypothetical protein EDD15DRAFT_2156792 [Pisolithus albus]|nr:hypothetical protein EDD15DRAFT_2156792 [Pisolithus albus]
MKSLRKSFNGNKDAHRLQISTPLPLPSISKPLSASLPPQKVIRAINSFRPTAPTQLPFSKGDFFYVTGDPDNYGPWYEAHNPVTGARGLVPKNMFEEFCKSPNPIRSSHISVGPSSPVSPLGPPTSPKSPKSSVFYAIVIHNFTAERTDELDAKAGDPISVVAHSNREWFVAKPIGRLGRPGLIPATFVQVRDPVTNAPILDIDALIDRGDLPEVEDWKRAMISYKQNSIALGVIEDPKSSVTNSPYAPSLPASEPAPTSSTTPLPDGILLSASVVSFHFEMDEYWFRVDAIFQPYPFNESSLPMAKQLVLFRAYHDFYDFQLHLLDAFPNEAGREPSSTRILPFMPGPSSEVNDQVTATRREELDAYLQQLCALNSMGASYILEHQLIRDFLALKSGDVEHEIEPRYNELNALTAGEANQEIVDGYSVTRDFDEEVRDTLGDMRLSERDDRSDGSYYGEDLTPPTQSHPLHHPGHQRSSTLTSIRHNGSQSQASPMDSFHENGASRGSVSSDSHLPDYKPSPPSSMHSSQPSSRTRSSSAAHTNLNAPPVSAENPQTAFVRIKIFVVDDLIAIRVHPKVTHSELMKKVQGRLGTYITTLQYRDSLSNELVGLENDDDLREWLDRTAKHVLYAE